eukprot:GHRR01009852.1.p2 GENE.GHRR01009852.1~~GHRR01009852.1.p2  ORF type:complete len:119 (-),score=21.03 GHRR01009852.1:326-682(-)
MWGGTSHQYPQLNKFELHKMQQPLAVTEAPDVYRMPHRCSRPDMVYTAIKAPHSWNSTLVMGCCMQYIQHNWYCTHSTTSCDTPRNAAACGCLVIHQLNPTCAAQVKVMAPDTGGCSM